MATKFKHSYKEFTADAIRRRIQQMLEYRSEVDVPNAHVKLSYGNRKTGALVPSVSLIPIADCGNCAVCAKGCYDVRNVCYLPAVQRSRANNSAILRDDPVRYMQEIKEAVKFLRFFRWHIGGDIKDPAYLTCMVHIAEATPTCEMLVFSKMDGIINDYLHDHPEGFPKNLHVILSDWRGSTMKNPYNLPVSSPVWPDGTKGPHCTERQFMCPGFCEDCAETHTGCWAAKSGDTILFEAH